MVAIIDRHREEYGTWPKDNLEVYGAQGLAPAPARRHCSCALHGGALMRYLGLRSAVRGCRFKTTIPNEFAARLLDLVDRDFTAGRPNQLCVSDITYLAIWRDFVYVAFVTRVFSRKIVGWRVSSSLRTDLALDALGQAVCERKDEREDRMIYHSDGGAGSFYTPHLRLRIRPRASSRSSCLHPIQHAPRAPHHPARSPRLLAFRASAMAYATSRENVHRITKVRAQKLRDSV